VGAGGWEIHNLLLMDTQDGVEALLAQQGEMNKGAERAISYEHISRAQRRMERCDLSHVMGVPRGCEHFQQEARPGMKQGEQVGHRDPTPWARPVRLAKVLLQLGCIRHRKTRPVDQERPVASPPPLVVGCLLANRRRPPPQLLPDAKRQAGTGLTKRRGRKVLAFQAGQVATRGVAMQDLQDKEMDSGDRIEQAHAPLVAYRVTQGENRGSVEQGRSLGFDVSEGFHDRAYHPGPPVSEKW
jgi:hypothetical protein